MSAPTESKVWGSTVGGGSGAVLTSFVLWVLGVTIWNVSINADDAARAMAAVPLPVAGLIGLVITVGGIFLGGWLAKHTPRPDLETYEPKRALIEEDEAVDHPVDEAADVNATDLLVPEYSTV